MTQDPTQTDQPDDISQAFDALRGEVGIARRAVEALTTARENIPNYSETLAQMAGGLQQTASGIKRLEERPAIKLTPDALALAIVKAGADARREDRALIHEARDALSRSIGHVDAIVERGQAADRQLRRLIWSGAGGAAMGGMLMLVLPGPIARALPESWHVPEWMAARTMGMEPRQAGERLVAITSAPATPSPAPASTQAPSPPRLSPAQR